MSENLIFGANILSYGAIPDGNTDCTEAFEKAIQNGENLISVPFGTYLIKRGVKLSSNIKFHFHPRAIIKYAPEEKTDTPLFYGKDVASVIVNGGKFHADDNASTLFLFENCENIRFYSVSVVKSNASGIVFNSCNVIFISGCNFDTGNRDVFTFLDCCGNIVAKDCEINLACNAFQFGTKDKECVVGRVDIRNIVSHYVLSFIEFYKGSATDVALENISGGFEWSFFRLFEKFSLSDTRLEKINIYSTNRENEKCTNPAYFVFAETACGLELNNFKRNAELESIPLIPTMVFKAGAQSTAIIDGIALDNVISARGKSKEIGMTAAKLINPHGKFVYTVECSIDKGQTLTLPLGDFDYMRIDKA